MDGFGLAMFLPLLQMVDGNQTTADNEKMGNMSFLVKAFEQMGISLTIGMVLLLIFIFFTLKGILKFLEGYARVSYEQLFIKNIRLRNIRGLSNFSYSFFVNADSGRIQNTLSGEVEKVNQAYRYYFVSVQYGVFVLVYVAMAFFSNPQFAVLVAIGGGITSIMFKKLYKITKSLSKKVTSHSHTFQGLLIQKVSFFKYLKATGLLNKYADKLVSTSLKIQESQKKSGIIAAATQAVREPLIILVVVTVIIVQVKYFSQSIGIIILSLLLFYRALTYLIGLQNFWNFFLGVSGSLDNMTSFAKELKAGREQVGSIIFPQFKDKLELKNLSFFYETTQILNNIDLTINKNETIAIVGESGSGKTTLMNILTGLLCPGQGTVLVDGVNLEDINKRTFQQRIGYITQEPVIFNDTIFNNVTFWDTPSPENIERFNEAIKKASIYDFVMDQPLQAEAMLGNNGINVSGGQKQRLSIARELYKEVDFLFLDEATSALDSETERTIQDNMYQLKGKYTILIIAHRLSTVKDADKIVLLNKGKIESAGTFKDMVQESSSFKRMVELQAF
jgi:subfamily B ATP-binding cassette protein MsbA